MKGNYKVEATYFFGNYEFFDFKKKVLYRKNNDKLLLEGFLSFYEKFIYKKR
jgi:hypothetical protein